MKSSTDSRSRSAAALAAALAAVLAPGAAGAEMHLVAGTRWDVNRVLRPARGSQREAQDFETGAVRGCGAADGANEFCRPSLDPDAYWSFPENDIHGFLGLGVSEQLQIVLGLDYAFFAIAAENADADAEDIDDLTLNFFQFAVELGAKYYFLAPRKQWITPYGYAGVYKYFAAVQDTGGSREAAEFARDLASPFGFNLGLGAEYFFSPNFSLGAEFLGLRYAAFGSTAFDDFEQNHASVALYTSLTANFRFYGLVGGEAPVYPEPAERRAPTESDLEPTTDDEAAPF